MLRMVNETLSASEIADVNVEVMRNAATKNPCARRRAHGARGRLADGHGRLDRGRGTHPASSSYPRLRRVGLRVGGLYCPHPFSVHHHHDCHTHFSFDAHHLHRPSFV